MIGHWVEFIVEGVRARGLAFSQDGEMVAVVVLGSPCVHFVNVSTVVKLERAQLPA